MNVWTLLQIIVNLLFLVGFFAIWMRMRRPAKDDPRMSRGLQLMQSKIAVLEDLSDRTDRQVSQLSRLLENKARQLQNKFIEAEKQVQRLQNSMDKSMEVASIFQDRIPHSEIIERQNTIKHIQAARMANQGHGIEEIVAKVDLPREQLEFIAKVNKDQLVFDEASLPAWAEEPAASNHHSEEEVIDAEEKSFDIDEDHSLLAQSALQGEKGSVEFESLKKLGEQFKEACKDFDSSGESADSFVAKSLDEGFQRFTAKIAESDTIKRAKDMTHQVLQSVGDKIASDGVREKQPVSESGPVTETESEPVTENSEMVTFVASEPGLNSSGQSEIKKSEVKTVKFPNIDLDDNLG